MPFILPEIVHSGICDTSIEKPFQNITVSCPRVLTHYELELFLDGDGISFINGEGYPVKKGNILFGIPGDVRYSQLHFCCRFIHFDITDPALAAAVTTISKVTHAPSFSRMDSLFYAIASLSRSSNTLELVAASGRLTDILSKINLRSDIKSSPVADAQHFIEENYFEDISIDSIAANANVSASYLYKIFKESTGTTVGEYLTDCRISAAKYLLTTTSFSAGEIALRCGFNSQSYFSDNFKKKTGVTPLEFRRSWSTEKK